MTHKHLQTIDTLQTNLQVIVEQITLAQTTKTSTMHTFMTKMAQAFASGAEVTPGEISLLQDRLDDWKNRVESALNAIKDINPLTGGLGCVSFMGPLHVKTERRGHIVIISEMTGEVVPKECMTEPIAIKLYRAIRTLGPRFSAFSIATCMGLASYHILGLAFVLRFMGGTTGLHAILGTMFQVLFWSWENGVVSLTHTCQPEEGDLTCDINNMMAAIICATDPSSYYCLNRNEVEYAFTNPSELVAAMASDAPGMVSAFNNLTKLAHDATSAMCESQRNKRQAELGLDKASQG
jgi:hypothetical protein